MSTNARETQLSNDVESSFDIQPKELYFPPPLDRIITNLLQLSNFSNKRVSYKVKTTTPKRYVVRPTTGFLEPGGQVEVSVSLNFSKDDKQDADKMDKFLVMWKVCEDKAIDGKEFWVANKNATDVYNSKLRCFFQNPPNMAQVSISEEVDPNEASITQQERHDSPMQSTPQQQQGNRSAGSASSAMSGSKEKQYQSEIASLKALIEEKDRENIELRAIKARRDESAATWENALRKRNTASNSTKSTPTKQATGRGVERNAVVMDFTHYQVVLLFIVMIIAYLLGRVM